MGMSIPKPVRLVLLLQDLDFGGTQRYVINLITRIDREVFAPELWLLRHSEDMVDHARQAGVNVVWLGKSCRVGPTAIARLFLQLRRSRPDILYTLTGVPNIWGRLFGHILGIRAIVSSFRSLVDHQYERWLSPLSTRVVCNAEVIREMLMEKFRIDPGKAVCVPNGVDTEVFCPFDGDLAPEPTILYVGRLVEQKDPQNLLEAFRMVVERVPGVHLVMVGNGHLRSEVEEYVLTHGLGERVLLKPGTTGIKPDMQRAWVLAMPSNSEGSPNAVLEAMSMGLPVVATRVGGLPALLGEGEAGMLVPPRDPPALAEALTALLRDRNRRDSLGRKARSRAVELYSVEKMVADTQRVLLDALK